MKILRSAVAVVLLAAGMFASAAPPALAGDLTDYPEFPYPPTNYDEPFRGQFHFSPRAGWMNDPNGSFYYRGRYHLFYQHNPHGLAWATMHWGHAVSTDLVHWTQKPIALEPGVHAGDLWSGNGIVDTNNVTGLKSGTDDPILLFSGTGGVTVHYSLDGARTFQTYGGGREVVDTPGVESRDPKVFWHAPSRRYVMVLYVKDGRDGANFYTSTDLLHWEFRSRFVADWMFECPDMYQLPVDGNPANTRWVLSAARDNSYVLGDFDGTTFTPTSPVGREDFGGGYAESPFYASQTFTGDPAGRVVQTAWQGGNRGGTWTGNLTFPAQLGLRTFPDGVRLTREPVGELASLRRDPFSLGAQTLRPGTNPLSGLRADTYELTAEFDVNGATAAKFGFRLHTRANGGYDREVAYDRAAGTLYGAPLAPVNGRVRMRVLVDRGQLEIFAGDGRFSFSDNVYFDSASQGISLFTEGGDVRLVSLGFNRLDKAWGTGQSTLDGNLAGPWTASNGTWTDTAAGKQGTAAGDAFYLSSSSAADFSYEGDVRVDNGVAAALSFRAGPSGQYTVNVDTTGVVKLWRPGRDIASYATPVSAGRTYHLKVVAAGSRFQVFLDRSALPVIDATDTAYPSGRLGVNLFNGQATFNNLQVNATGLATNLAGPWRPVNGTWTYPGSGLQSRGGGDTFYLSSSTPTDFTYEGDLTPLSGVAAGLVFRANADGTQHYTANIDVGGVVKLWRPGLDIATYRTTIEPGRTYHLGVTARGADLRVSLDGTQVIAATDSTYSSGRLGVNGFHGTALFRNLQLR
ncbi:GH32 C-terminal domain-containing protein [Actinophytocola oryzae]|uniref:Levanase n=1 Tax=Actinophytocola oryzae TaxID=502181 RepID=A0A4R7UZY5_9PSEU|nr:glycoside hydrolase family 32 protein [Actinophytocola oryzae]TDV41115.1 levanase [Actinophytocola oryzae]